MTVSRNTSVAYKVDKKKFDDNWDRIFTKKDVEEIEVKAFSETLFKQAVEKGALIKEVQE